jgi:hypothetical protein
MDFLQTELVSGCSLALDIPFSDVCDIERALSKAKVLDPALAMVNSNHAPQSRKMSCISMGNGDKMVMMARAGDTI